ncbi:hypothetical protein P4056_14725 [Pseudomonas aeruginosa]|nr:hypothetical protein [Pseudomonas aeruginosa]
MLDALHAELGDSLWFFVSPLQFEDVPASLIAGAGEILHTSANAATTIARHIEDGRIDAAELAETQKLAMSIIRAAVGLLRAGSLRPPDHQGRRTREVANG